MGFLTEYVIPHFNFWIYVILLMIGLYAMITKNNLIKKLIGMSIFQTAIILFYVSLAAKEGARIPILTGDVLYAEKKLHAVVEEGGGKEAVGPQITQISQIEASAVAEDEEEEEVGEELLSYGKNFGEELDEGAVGHDHLGLIDPDAYANPLPHVLMLTAIVVGVATLGVGLAIVQMIYREYGTIEEKEILEKVKEGEGKYG
ncbi:MAG: cation:proton antiporter subunit C [Verrucomicrobiota bacterium]